MKKYTFCTIITFSHLPYIKALHKSIDQFQEITLNVLISDKTETDFSEEEIQILYSSFGINIFFYDQLSNVALARELHLKYWEKDMDSYRWSMKSIFIKYLIEVEDYEKVIYADSDLYFFNDFKFLFDELAENNILLTPHWRSSDPEKDKVNFDLLFVGGLFNAGFIGVNKNGLAAMEWWAMACLYQCTKDFTKGQYVDQTYLNLFPILFDKVKIIKHKGCNVANWNQIDCPRTIRDNTVLIDYKWPIVFIHFTKSTINGILLGEDKLLLSFYNEYKMTLKSFGREEGISDVVGEGSTTSYSKKLKFFIKNNLKNALR